jgi:hypothetical protein
MQKLQFYLLPNRITVTTDLVGNGFTTEFRQVYQRTIKLYKGIDNTIELDVRSSDQRRQNLAGKTAVLSFFDAQHRNLFVASGLADLSKVGLVSVRISKEDLENIDPQQLQVAAKLVDTDSNESIVYSDSQFGLFCTAEILDGYNSRLDEILEEITIFNYEYDSKEYVSEIGTFGTSINDDHSTLPTRSVTFEYVPSTFSGIIVVEVTRDKSTAFGTTWTKLEDWNTEDSLTKTYTGDYRFVRFRINRDRSAGAGSGARFTVTKNNGSYNIDFITLRGQNYIVGDRLTILGSFLGGVDGINDLTVTVTGVVNGSSSRGNIDSFTWSGTATIGFENFESVGSESLVRPPNPVDKIIIRN